MVLISRGHMFGGTLGTPTRTLCFLNAPFQRCSGGLLFAGGCCFLPLVHSPHVCSLPSLRPPLLAERRSWINSDPSARSPAVPFSESAGTERRFLSRPSWAGGRQLSAFLCWLFVPRGWS